MGAQLSALSPHPQPRLPKRFRHPDPRRHREVERPRALYVRDAHPHIRPRMHSLRHAAAFEAEQEDVASSPQRRNVRSGWKADVRRISIHFMGLFSKPSIVELLDREQPMLDHAFGVGSYEVDSSHPEQATVRSSLLEARFGCERDGAIGALIVLRDPPTGTCGEAETWLWAKFLDVDAPPMIRDHEGRVQAAPEQQLRREVEMIGRLVRDIFSDPQKAREAAFYVEGYTRAYNDWASGNWQTKACGMSAQTVSGHQSAPWSGGGTY